MELWLAVFLGPLTVIGVGAGLVKSIQVLCSSDGFLRLVSWRGFDTIVLVVLAAFGLVLLAGLVALWQVNPLLALFFAAITMLGASRVWVMWHQRQRDDQTFW